MTNTPNNWRVVTEWPDGRTHVIGEGYDEATALLYVENAQLERPDVPCWAEEERWSS